jgi:hypothetical protein
MYLIVHTIYSDSMSEMHLFVHILFSKQLIKVYIFSKDSVLIRFTLSVFALRIFASFPLRTCIFLFFYYSRISLLQCQSIYIRRKT